MGIFISLSLLTVQSFCPSGLFLGGRCSRPFPLLAGLTPWPAPRCENVGRLPVLVWLSTLSVLFVFLFRNDWNRGPFFILFHWLFPWPETKSKMEQHSATKSKALILEILLVWQGNRKYRMNGDPWLYTGLRPKGWSIMTTNNFVIVCDSWRYEQKHDSYVSSLPLVMVECVGVEPPRGRVEVTNLLKTNAWKWWVYTSPISDKMNAMNRLNSSFYINNLTLFCFALIVHFVYNLFYSSAFFLSCFLLFFAIFIHFERYFVSFLYLYRVTL